MKERCKAMQHGCLARDKLRYLPHTVNLTVQVKPRVALLDNVGVRTRLAVRSGLRVHFRFEMTRCGVQKLHVCWCVRARARVSALVSRLRGTCEQSVLWLHERLACALPSGIHVCGDDGLLHTRRGSHFGCLPTRELVKILVTKRLGKRAEQRGGKW